MDFQTYLQEELLARCQRNPKYSLRAFASSLGIGSSDLSKIIRRKRGLTSSTVLRLGAKLGLAAAQIEIYRSQLTKQKPSSEDAVSKPSDYEAKQLSLDTFRLISDWYHTAILELTKIKGFQANEKWIAKRLGITISEVNIAVQRLVRLNMLQISPKGKWIDTAGSTTSVNDEYTDHAKKKLQKQILSKAVDALEETPFSERDQSAIMMAVNKSKLPAAKALIKNFRRQLCALLESGEPKEQVYYLSVSLFPVLKPEKSDSGG